MAKNTIKILIPTPVFPEKKSIRINFINQIVTELNKTVNIEVIWFVFLPDKFTSYYFKESKVSDIHDFCDGIDALKKIQPDCVLVGSHFDPIQHSLSLAAKKLKIPLCSFFYFDYKTENADNRGKINQLNKYMRIISSKNMPSDTEKKSKFLRRFKFIFYKFSFLKNTQQTLKIYQPPNFIFFIKNLTNYIFWKKIPINILADLFLLPNSSWIEPLLKQGIKKEKLSVTGNPLWDRFVLKSTPIKNRSKDSKVSILIVTDSLPQHGIWSLEKFSCFIKLLLSNLFSESKFSVSLKIHPASENKQFYEKILFDFKKYIPIFQNQSIWEIIHDYDLIVSFGFSTIHSEIVLNGNKMILVDFNFNFPYLDFVEESINFGNTKICNNINSLNDLIFNFVDIKSDNDKFQEQIKSKFNLTGKSSKYCAESIKKLMKIY